MRPDQAADGRATPDAIPSALRIVRGEQPGLTGSWRHGVATVSSGRIQLRRNLWQFRFANPFATAIDIQVEGTSSERDEPAPSERAMDWWSVDSGLSVVTLMTSSATLYWALPEESVELALSRLP